MNDVVCPTPWKIGYESLKLAVDGTKRSSQRGNKRMKGQPRPYHCECGLWHVTSMSRAAVRQLRRRKAA